MHLAGISGVLNRTTAKPQPQQHRRPNGVQAQKPLRVHNVIGGDGGAAAAAMTTTTRPKSRNAINGTGFLPPSSSMGGGGGVPRTSSSAALSGLPAWWINSRASISHLKNLQQPDHRSRQLSAHRRWLSRNKVEPFTGPYGSLEQAAEIPSRPEVPRDIGGLGLAVHGNR